MFARKEIARIRTEALRRRVWFRVTRRVDRALMDAVVAGLERVRSPTLTEALRRIIDKLREAMKSFRERLREIGRPIASRMALVVASWGHPGAHEWAEDPLYAEYLGMTLMGHT